MKVHPIDQIKAGLQKSYGSLDFDESPILGTYGLVLLATDSRTGSRLAFKTIDVAQIASPHPAKILLTFSGNFESGYAFHPHGML